MAETLKLNLDRAFTSLRIISIVAGGLIACFVAYANVDGRMDRIEQDQAAFKGVMDERTRNTAKRVDDIYDIVKDWGPE